MSRANFNQRITAVEWPLPNQTHTLVFDFDGVFTNNKVYLDALGNELVCCDRRDGLAIDIIRKRITKQALDIDYFILSQEKNPVTLARAEKLKIKCYSGVEDKLAFLTSYLAERCSERSDPFQGMIYLGNDLNDLPVLAVAGFSVVPIDAHDRVKNIANVVLDKRGGEGFVRAFVEQWLGIGHFKTEEIMALFSEQ